MKNVRIKDGKVIAVWYVGQESDYDGHFPDYDEDIQVEESVQVFPGMTKFGTKRITFKKVEDPVEVANKLYAHKKYQARQLIRSRYSTTDQLNLTQEATRIIGETMLEQRQPTTAEMERLVAAKEARVFIESVLNELHTNKDQADFSKYEA